MNENITRLQRRLRSPAAEAGRAVDEAHCFWTEMISKVTAEHSEHDFGELADSNWFSKLFYACFDDPDITGDELVDKIGQPMEGQPNPEDPPPVLFQVMVAVIGYAVQTVKAEILGEHNEAWSYAVKATYWSGFLTGTWREKLAKKNPAAELAKRRHAENYALIQEALNYWREKIDPNLSASKAANELVCVVPLSHKKLAELVAKEKKKNQKP